MKQAPFYKDWMLVYCLNSEGYMKHIPGPWFYNDGDNTIEAFKSDGHGKSTMEQLFQCFDEPDETDVANIKLALAAPELLEALEACHAVLWNGYSKDSDAYKKASQKAADAIVKARGEAS